MASISVVINTRNEGSLLKRAIMSVKNFADEVVVVDMESTDQSAKIAKDLGAIVFSHRPLAYVEPARNFGISKATSDWILIMDPDEEIPKSLSEKLLEIVKSDIGDYYRIPRKNLLFDKWMQHSRWWPDYNIRFFRKGKVSWNEIIHTVPVTTGDGLDLEMDEKYAITHYNYQTIEQFIERMNRYTSVQAEKLHKEKKVFIWADLLKVPSEEFFSRYFFGKGYKDGVHGLSVSLLQSVSGLVVILKLWQLGGFEDKKVSVKSVVAKMREVEKDAHYWQADAKVNTSYGVSRITHKVKRKFKLP